MPTCSFCKTLYEFPRGMTVVQRDTTVKHFCSSKCRKNSEMGRISKKVNWVKKSDVVKAENEKRAKAKAAAKAAKA
jgi:large subunit ribosomal protein L24e